MFLWTVDEASFWWLIEIFPLFKEVLLAALLSRNDGSGLGEHTGHLQGVTNGAALWSTYNYG